MMTLMMILMIFLHQKIKRKHKNRRLQAKQPKSPQKQTTTASNKVTPMYNAKEKTSSSEVLLFIKAKTV